MEVVDWKRYPPSYFSKCASSTLKKNIYKSNANCSLSRRINNQRARAFFSNVQHFPLHLQNKNQQKIIILSKTKQRSKKKEILGSFPLHGTLSSLLLPFTFHSRQRKFLQWRDLLFSVDGGVRAPSSSVLLRCLHAWKLAFPRSLFFIALQSLLFFIYPLPFSPNPPERIIVRVPYSFAAISKAPLKKRAAIENCDFFLSL